MEFIMKRILTLALSLFLFCAFAPTAMADEAPDAPKVVNINSADAETLATLHGIGPSRAEAIIAWRDANGEFVSVDQLAERSEEHTSELQSRGHLVCRLLLER